jgi:uncharacterized protein YbaP (TraB family)
MKKLPISAFMLTIFCLFHLLTEAQNTQQKGLLWQITGNGLKKPSYVYGTMHVSQKIAFHLGDSFYIALAKSDVVALEQDLDSVIHRWISESDNVKPEDIGKVFKRSSYDFLNLYNFTLSSYNKYLIQRKLSAEVREVNYLLTRGDQDDFEEDAWLDLYIYQIAKKLGKGFTGVEGYEESRELVKKSQKEPKDSKEKKKPRRYNYNLRQQVAEAYRKGDIYMLDSIDRMTESDHYREYMLYRRNANMVRRMDSIMQLGKTMFTGVGCSHLPGTKGVLQMLIEQGYKVRPVQSIALEKSKMAKKYEEMKMKHKYATYSSEDGLLSATLPTRLTMVNDNSYYSSYLSPDLANGYYYQIEKIACNTIFSGKTPEDILLVIDTLIFENIPGEITEKKEIVSNGFKGIEVVTRLKTNDLNRFQILASPFNVYIIRMSGKENFAISSDANNFFKSLKINEGGASGWKKISSPDSVFTLELPSNSKLEKLPMPYKANPSFEHLVYDKSTGNTYLIKQEDILNEHYLEHDTFELNVMARSFAATDNFKTLNQKHFDWQGYHALDAVFENKTEHKMHARFVICGTRYIMFVLKPNGNGGDFNDRFFSSIKFNGKPSYTYFEYTDTSSYFTVKTPVLPLVTKNSPSYSSYYGEDEEDTDKDAVYKGLYNVVYFKNNNANEFISVGSYKYGYYQSQKQSKEEYYKSWKKDASLILLDENHRTTNGIEYVTYTYSDTNTTRQFKAMHALHGQMRYYVEAFIDTVAGKNEFVESFFETFDVSDTLLNDDIFKKKGYRFFADFTSNDSATRSAAIRYYDEVSFGKYDINNLCNVIDTISMKGDAANLRTSLINKLSRIDSAQDLLVPYLDKLYKRFSDTAYMQLEILEALARQQSEKAFKSIKPILALDIPISDNAYDMRQMLYAFGDSLKLTKIILPELIELTGITEYRNTAYNMISRMKDSGIITVNDYASIHDKLVKETKIEYKRMMASLTKENSNKSYNYYNNYDYDISMENITSTKYQRNYYNSNSNSYSLLSDILDLSLPLKSKNNTIEEITAKILKLTDNEKRLKLLPVLIKYGIHFEDSVYQTLAKTKSTRIEFYEILAEAEQLDKFPKQYLNHKDWIIADIYEAEDDYSKIDTIAFLDSKIVLLGQDTAKVYVCKFKMEDTDEWNLYLSDALPLDSNTFNHPKDELLFISTAERINSEIGIEKMADDILFENRMKFTRERNGGYYDSYSSRRNRRGNSFSSEY